MNKAQQDQLTMAKLIMLRRMPYYGTYAVGLDWIEDYTIPTAGTNGTQIKFNPHWIIGGEQDRPLRDVQEIVFIAAHEVLHNSFKHMLRQGWRDPMLFNISCDFAINLILTEGKVGTYPTPWPEDKDFKKYLDDRFKGMTAEEIYDLLEKERQKQGGGKKIKMPNGVIIDLSKPGSSDIGGFEQPVNADGSALTEAQQAELERTIDGNTSAAAASAKSQGKLPADLERLVTTVLKPKIDWRERLRMFVAKTFPSDYSWSKPHRRYIGSLDLYLPHVEKSGVGKILVILDTSGSIDFSSPTSEGAQFFSEIKGIYEDCYPEELIVMYCDAAVAGVDVFTQGQEPELNARGGGGTDFRPPFELVEKEGMDIQCAVYLTDGLGSWPTKPMPYPVLWVIDTDVVPPWGEHVRLER